MLCHLPFSWPCFHVMITLHKLTTHKTSLIFILGTHIYLLYVKRVTRDCQLSNFARKHGSEPTAWCHVDHSHSRSEERWRGLRPRVIVNPPPPACARRRLKCFRPTPSFPRVVSLGRPEAREIIVDEGDDFVDPDEKDRLGGRA